jgi:hypothetical protein
MMSTAKGFASSSYPFITTPSSLQGWVGAHGGAQCLVMATTHHTPGVVHPFHGIELAAGIIH